MLAGFFGAKPCAKTMYQGRLSLRYKGSREVRQTASRGILSTSTLTRAACSAPRGAPPLERPGAFARRRAFERRRPDPAEALSWVRAEALSWAGPKPCPPLDEVPNRLPLIPSTG